MRHIFQVDSWKNINQSAYLRKVITCEREDAFISALQQKVIKHWMVRKIFLSTKYNVMSKAMHFQQKSEINFTVPTLLSRDPSLATVGDNHTAQDRPLRARPPVCYLEVLRLAPTLKTIRVMRHTYRITIIPSIVLEESRVFSLNVKTFPSCLRGGAIQ